MKTSSKMISEKKGLFLENNIKLFLNEYLKMFFF